jgi:hypothetical protein
MNVTDENFEIRPEFVDEQDYRRTTSLDRVARAVVLLVAAYVLASALGWFGTIPKPQPSTRSANEPAQTDGRSAARPIGGERSSSPSAGRSTPTQRGAQEAPENEVVVEEAGASAPVFQWVCGGVRTFCRLDSNGVALQGFLLRNGGIVASAIRPSLATPAAWECEVRNGTELFCSIQDGRGRIVQSFIYDGNVVKEVR